MEYCTTLITDSAHYTTVQNLRVFRGVKTLWIFARTPNGVRVLRGTPLRYRCLHP